MHVREDPMEKLREAEQQVKFLETLNKLLKTNTSKLEETKKELEKRLNDNTVSSAEKEQEQKLLEYINTKYSNAKSSLQKDIKTNQKTEILSLFRIFKQMNVSLLQNITKKDTEELKSILLDLEKEEKIISLGSKQEPICSECSSGLLTMLSVCPNCDGASFENDVLIEHYSCGNISSEKSYENDICPNCKKNLKALGVDHRIDENYHFCNDCAHKFPNPNIKLVCRYCNTSHTHETIKFNESIHYKLIL